MNPPPPPPDPTPRRTNWWTRNWKWFVPTGCLSLIVLFAGFAALLTMVIFGAMKSSDVYKDALAKAKAHPAVIEALGSPIEAGMFLSGNTNVNGASGEANLAIPISGPNGKGTIYVAATKSAGKWTYSTLAVEIKKTGERIDLLNSTSPSRGLHSP